jgi:hypothetical protein
MADAEIPQTQKESDNMKSLEKIWKTSHAVGMMSETGPSAEPLNQRRMYDGNHSYLNPPSDNAESGNHVSPYAHADRLYRDAIEQCARTSSENQTMRRENADLNGENNALHREVSRLQAKVDALELDNRTIRCFAQSLKTRLHAVAEACDKAIAESLTDAAEEVKKELPQDDPVPAFLTAEMPSQAEG